GPDVLADLSHPLVRGAHEGSDAVIERDVDDVDDGARVLELHRLCPRARLGHVIDAEELVVAQQEQVHLVPGHRALLRPKSPRRPVGLGGTELPPASAASPRESARILSMTASVCAATSKGLRTAAGSLARTASTNARI